MGDRERADAEEDAARRHEKIGEHDARRDDQHRDEGEPLARENDGRGEECEEGQLDGEVAFEEKGDGEDGTREGGGKGAEGRLEGLAAPRAAGAGLFGARASFG